MIGHAKPSYLPNPYGALRMVALLCGLHPGSLTLVSRRSPQDSISGLTTAAQMIRQPCPGQVAPAESLNRVKQAHPLGSLSPPSDYNRA